jgi:hypothetical protein
MNQVSVYRPSMLQRVARDSAEPAACTQVRVVPSLKAAPETVAISVNVRYACVVNVHIAEITPTPAIPRMERLSPSEGAPSIAAAKSETEANSPVAASKPSDHGRRIPPSRPTAIVGPGRPSPVRAEAHPTAVMEWSKSPRSIILPGPSPRVDPYPVSVGVWRPTRCDGAGDPHRPVFRGVTPGAIVVQIFRSDNVGGNVTGGNRIVLSSVT